MKKKARSQNPALTRMTLRLEKSRALSPAERELYCYCAGRGREEFLAAVADGQTAAVVSALDVLTANLWVRPRDRAHYGPCLRGALYSACEAGRLAGKVKRAFFDLEWRLAEELLARARYSTPGAAQLRARRRLSAVTASMSRCFGDFPEYLERDNWPIVSAPANLLSKARRKGWFSLEQAELLGASSHEVLMRFLHGAGEELLSFVRIEAASQPTETLCYFFSEHSETEAVWQVAPWQELEDLCGVILAADASFCYVVDDWGDLWQPS